MTSEERLGGLVIFWSNQVFKLAYPVLVKLNKAKSYSGLYENELDDDGFAYHYVRISLLENKTEEEQRDTLLHELIHCWQYENRKNVAHGASFKKWCDYFKTNYGYDIK